VSSLGGVAQVLSAPGVWRTDLLLTAPDRSGSMDVVSVAADGSTTTTTMDVTAGSTRVVPLVGVGAWLRPRPGTGPVVVAKELAVKLPTGLLITSIPVRDSESSRVPADIAAAAD
jgi:hypothetical protein